MEFGLHHVAHEAEGENDGHGEESGESLAESAGEGGADVVGRSADGFARVRWWFCTSERARLRSSWWPCRRRRSATSRRWLRGRRLAMAVAAPAMLPVPTWAATAVASAWNELMPVWSALSPCREMLLNRRRKAWGQLAQLNEAQPDGVENARAAEQEEQKPAPEHAVDRIDYLTDEFHKPFLRAHEERCPQPVMPSVSGYKKRANP